MDSSDKIKNAINKINLADVVGRIKQETGTVKKKKKKSGRNVVDIITFCEHKDYLRFLDIKPAMILTRVQRIILKCFYAGSEGNENLSLTNDEIEWLKNWKQDKDKEKQSLIDSILDKHENKKPITELILVLGRRSGKTMLASIIATYEAYKCLELYNPQEYFGLAPDNQINILNIATASPQAKILYNEIKARIRHSAYFRDKLNQESSSEEYTYLLTQSDKDTNDLLRGQGRIKELIKGSIVIQCGHSNSNSLMGTGIICLIFDELAYFKDGAGASGGQKVYGDLVPNTKAFKHPDGSPAARIVEISAPAGKAGVFYQNFKISQTPEGEGMMAFQFPTWECSPVIKSKEDLAAEFKKNEQEATIRYGAEFSGFLSTTFFPLDLIELSVNYNLFNRAKGLPHIRYFMHVDPALTGHNYALVILHEERYMDKETREQKRRIIVDHCRKWSPVGGKEVDLLDVEKYIIDISRKFNIVSITFDDWNSANSIQKFRRMGLPVKRTPFRSSYKQLIYAELRSLVISGDLALLPDEYLIGEFKNIQYRMMARGYKLFPDTDCEYPTDDYCDCVAGAAHMSLAKGLTQLPQTTTTRTTAGLAGRMMSMFGSSPQINYGRTT